MLGGGDVGAEESQCRLNIVMSVSHRRWTMASSIGPTTGQYDILDAVHHNMADSTF